MSPLDVFTQFTQIGTPPISRLVYNEFGSKAITELCRPAYRLAVAQGLWPPSGKNPAELLMPVIQNASALAIAAQKGEENRCHEIPALSMEEKIAADLFLQFANYCTGRNIDIGHAVMCVHLRNASQPKRK